MLSVLLGAAIAAAATGCLSDDVGTCCQVLDETKSDLIPVAPPSDPNDPSAPVSNVIRQDPAFDCSGLTCTAYQGTKAFCTRQCNDSADCPEGFACQNVLESDPGPGAMLSPDDKFCVKVAHDCDSYDP